MACTDEELKFALGYLQRFLDSRVSSWHDAIREAGPARYGRESDSGDNEAISILRDVVFGLTHEFEDLRVPEGFPSPERFVGAVKRYGDFIATKLPRLEEINASHGERWHGPVHQAYRVCEELREAMNHILTLVGASPLQIPAHDRLIHLLNGMPEVARQLLKRQAGRHPFTIVDEYDIQDLLRALLHLEFSDVRPEEWNPSYAGKSSRTDFLLPEARTAIEVKHARANHAQASIVTELNTDAKRYRDHPSVDHLVCVVWDTDRKLSNPSALKSDVERHENGFVTVVVLH